MRTSLFPSKLIAISAAALALVSSAAFAADNATLRISGSTTVEKSVLQPNLDKIRAATGISVELHCKGTGPGILDLANGHADASGASEELQDAVASAKKAAAATSTSVNVPSNLVFSEVGRDRLAIIVNGKNSAISTLTKDQLKDIFTRKITNWKAVGGPDQPINLILSPPGSATFAVFQKVIMDGAAVPPDPAGQNDTLHAASTFSEIKEVQLAQSAIAVVSESVAKGTDGIRIVQTPVIDRPLGLITIGKPSADAQKLIDYLRGDTRTAAN